MQNLATSNFPQLNFLGPMPSSGIMASSSQQLTTQTNSTSSTSNVDHVRSSSAFKQEIEEGMENNMAGLDHQQQQQFGMDNNSLQQALMMAAASMDQSSPLHNFYLSQLQATTQSSEPMTANSLTSSSTNPTPTNNNDSYTNIAVAAAAQAQQQLLEQLFGSTANNQHINQENNNSNILTNPKNPFQSESNPNINNSVSGFGDLNANELAQIMASLINNGNSGNELMQNGTQQKTLTGQCHTSNGQSSNAASTAPSQPVSPNSQQQNNSSLFDQLQLLNLFGATNGLPADLFGSTTSNQMPMGQNQLPIDLSQLAGIGGPDFASLAASLGLGNLSNGMDASNNNQAVAAAAAALLSCSGGNFSFSGSPNKSLDSYCEICDKNLCNRYFLKTHKLKKHGLSDDGTTGSPIKTNFGQTGFDTVSFLNATQNRAISTSSTNANQLTSSVIVSQSASNSFGGEDKGISGDSSPMAKMPNLSSSSIPSSTAPSIMSGLIGGNTTNNMAQLFNGKSALDFLNSFPSAMAGEARTAETEQRSTRSPMENQSTMGNHFNEPNSTTNACDFCDKEFDSRINLLQHQIIQHGGSSITSLQQNNQRSSASPISSAVATQASSAPDTTHNVQSQLNANSFLNNLLPTGLQLPFLLPSQLTQFGGDLGEAQAALAKMGGANPTGAVSSPTAQGSSQQQQQKSATKRQYSSTSKNYCDLCNKEVCNKYFLRTHMLKMHNIVIDENKSVIANIDTLEKEKAGSISFRCDICMIELKTRNDLRLHKRETHGVVPLLTPPANHNNSSQGSITPSRTPKSATLNPSNHSILGSLSANRLSQHQQHFFGPTLDENHQMPALLKDEEDFESQTNATTSDNLAANVEYILNSIAAQTTTSLKSERHIKKEEYAKSEDANSLDNNIPSSSASSTFETANSATSSASSTGFKCRFCGDHFGDEIKMHVHTLNNHASEILGQALAGPLNMFDGGQLPLGDDNDIITRVALQMAQANQALNQPANPPAPAQFTCTHCNRRYKSKLSLANHTRSVHHNFVAKLSPTKSKRPVISPKKVKKLRSCFTCMKCQRRFSTRVECSEHVIGHFKAEKAKEEQDCFHSTACSAQPEAKKIKLVRSSSSEDNKTFDQDSNNNSALHACTSFPGTETQVETAKSALPTYEETFLNTFIREEETLEDSHPLSLEIAENGPATSHSYGSMSFDDEALLLIDEQDGMGSHAVVNQVVSEVYEDRCRLNRASQRKDEKHSHTSSETYDQTPVLSVATAAALNVVSPWSSLLLPVKVEKQPLSSPSAINFSTQCSWGPAPSSVSNSNVQLHQC